MCRTILSSNFVFFFFFNDTATTEIYTLSLHDALPILNYIRTMIETVAKAEDELRDVERNNGVPIRELRDRKSTRLNSSHANISYAVFCLKKKNQSKE